jgi:hypothetical protein
MGIRAGFCSYSCQRSGIGSSEGTVVKMTSHAEHRRTAGMASPVQTVATVVGLGFLAVGILGFIPGVTTDLDTITFAGHDSDAMLLGAFQVSVLHNVVHMLFGVVGLALGRAATTARYYLVGGGAIYLLLWLYGLIIDRDSTANFVPVNSADQWLHLGLAAVMIALGVVLGTGSTSSTSGAHQDDRGSGPII